MYESFLNSHVLVKREKNCTRVDDKLMIVHKRLYETSLYERFLDESRVLAKQEQELHEVDRRVCIKVFKTSFLGQRRTLKEFDDP